MNSKLFYSIQKASEYTGVPPHTIRYWEKEYNLIRPEKDSRGRRRYKNADLELIKKIKELIYDKKYKAEGVKKKLKQAKKESLEESPNDTLNIIKKELESILEIVNR
jgi:DNA-binding transcriptional MerR regulator